MKRLDYKIEGIATRDMTVEEFIDQIQQYSKPVQGIIWDELIWKLDSLDEILLGCTSPIEQALVIPISKMVADLERFKHIPFATYQCQYPVSSNKKTYRVDFMITISLDLQSTLGFVIECDGHDFHEKTKDQAKKDKQRERALTLAGYTVIRFTGSEIHNDPYKCVDEIRDIILAKIGG